MTLGILSAQRRSTEHESRRPFVSMLKRFAHLASVRSASHLLRMGPLAAHLTAPCFHFRLTSAGFLYWGTATISTSNSSSLRRPCDGTCTHTCMAYTYLT